MKFLYVLISVLAFSQCKIQEKSMNQEEVLAGAAISKVGEHMNSMKPIMLDDIHYYTLDREACNVFFEQNFGTQAMLEDSPNPFEFIDFQLVKHQQSTINISEQGPFPGIRVGDPKRWERKKINPAPNNPSRYGVHWLALSTNDLDATILKLKSNAVEIVNENFVLPHEPSRSALIYGPDYNLIVVKEDKANGESKYSIDHLMLLVNDLSENTKFYTEVFKGEVVSQHDDHAIMIIGNHKFILASPSYLGIEREAVIERDPNVFRPDIDHLGFLYKNITPAYEDGVAKGYKFLSPPVPIKYFGKATLYSFAITYSPDGLQCELFQEAGRTTSRVKNKTRN